MCVLKLILLNTNSLSKYLQGKNIDVLKARINASQTIKALEGCRNERDFNLIWEKAHLLSNKVKSWIVETEFSFRDARVPRTVKNATTSESHHRINTYFLSLDKVQGELKVRFDENDHKSSNIDPITFKF